MYAIINQSVILHNIFFAAKFTVFVFPISEDKLCFICHMALPVPLITRKPVFQVIFSEIEIHELG